MYSGLRPRSDWDHLEQGYVESMSGWGHSTSLMEQVQGGFNTGKGIIY
jgi:hypothetical protein